MSAERKAKSLEYVFADLIDQIRADRQRKQNLWERFIDGERWAVSQEIYRLEDIIATKSAILNGLYKELNE